MPTEEYEAIGRRLRDNRLHHQLSLKQVAVSIHIRAQYLEALENGRLELLPGLVYAKGYLQSYTEFLGLDPKEILEAFDKAGEFPQRRLFQLPQSMDRHPDPGKLLAYATLSLALGIAVAWVTFAPRSARVAAHVPFPVSEAMLKHLPPACKAARAPAYPPCYWKRAQGR